MNGIAYYYTDSARTELVLTNGAPRSYPWHMHTQHWTFGAVSSGTVTVTTENGPKKLKGGEQFFIRPYEPHSLAVASKSSLLVFCAENLSFLDASCCKVEVIKGGAGLRLLSERLIRLAVSLPLAFASN